MNEISKNILAELNVVSGKQKPASWLQRLAGVLYQKRNKRQAMVHPCVIDGKQTLVYERGLPDKDPNAYRLVQEFAITQGYRLKEDQRADFLEGIKRVKNKGRANAVSVLVLTAGLMSQSAYAKSIFDQHQESLSMANKHHAQVDTSYDFDFDAYHTEQELISGLLTWINDHSSFEFDVENIPAVKKVNAQQIAEVAFGGSLPKSIDAKSLRIFGLYNFNEKAVYLLDSIDLDSKEGKGILLHELVHYLQYQTGLNKNVRCKNELETLAYVLEARFLESQRVRHNISHKHINKVSQCRV